MIYLIYLICSSPLVYFLENQSRNSFVGKALNTLDVVEKILFYLIPIYKEIYVMIAFLERKRPDWFSIKNDF
jgi:hypothetical protein